MSNIDNEVSYLTDKDLFDRLSELSSMQEECIQRAYVLGLKHILSLAKSYIQNEIDKRKKGKDLFNQGKIRGLETSLEIIEHIFNGDNYE